MPGGAATDRPPQGLLEAWCLVDEILRTPRPIRLSAHAIVRFAERAKRCGRQAWMPKLPLGLVPASDFGLLVLLAAAQPAQLQTWVAELTSLLLPYEGWPSEDFCAPAGAVRLVVRGRRLLTVLARGQTPLPSWAA